MKKNQWTVSEAKTHLSEIMRKCREEGPQQIGKRNGCVVISQKEWEETKNQKEEPHLGRWLVENTPKIEDFEIPGRGEKERPIPFHEDEE